MCSRVNHAASYGLWLRIIPSEAPKLSPSGACYSPIWNYRIPATGSLLAPWLSGERVRQPAVGSRCAVVNPPALECFVVKQFYWPRNL